MDNNRRYSAQSVILAFILIALTAMVAWRTRIPWIWLQIVCQIGIYVIYHELSHALAASILGIPIDFISFGDVSLAQPVVNIGGVEVKMSRLPWQLSMVFGWAPLTRRRQTVLGISGALFPLLTWPLAGWIWHVILVTGMLSWVPGMPDARLVYPTKRQIFRPDVLRWANHSYPIAHMDQQNGDMHVVVDGTLIVCPPQKAWLESVAPGTRSQLAVEILATDFNSSQICLRSHGQPYRIEQRRHMRCQLGWSGWLTTDHGRIPCLIRDISWRSVRITVNDLTEPISTDFLALHWRGIPVIARGTILRQDLHTHDIILKW
ncbi:MAG: hypothetical protein M1499_04895 [Firmicutes bacterium]|nr:hypothetical protein [Bacillota bacterium]